MRQQKMQAERRAHQVLPYHRSDVDPVFPTTLWATRNVTGMRQNNLVRIDSSTNDPELPSYSTFHVLTSFRRKQDSSTFIIDAPAITLPQAAYNPSQTAPIGAVPYSLRPVSQTSLSALPPPPYMQKLEEQSELVSRQDTRGTGGDTRGGLPAYADGNPPMDRRT